jgi:decaprenyl-phosphate phosphoribosyltransferase
MTEPSIFTCVGANPVNELPLLDLTGFSHRWVDTGGVRLHAVEGGQPTGPAVVLLAGFPQTWFRPIAAGVVAPSLAYALAIALAAAALTISIAVVPALALVIAIYLAIQLAYCFGLKHQAVLDICIVSSAYLIRAIAGGAATGIPLSQWFLLVMAFASLFMVSGKRYAELQLAERTGAKIRRSLESYTSTYLRFVWTMSATAVVVFYGLWAFARDAHSGSWFAVSMIPITIAVLRYAVDVDGGMAGEPEDIVLRERVLQFLGVAWIAIICAAITFAQE